MASLYYRASPAHRPSYRYRYLITELLKVFRTGLVRELVRILRWITAVEPCEVIPGKVSQSRTGLGSKSAESERYHQAETCFRITAVPLSITIVKYSYGLFIRIAQMAI